MDGGVVAHIETRAFVWRPAPSFGWCNVVVDDRGLVLGTTLVAPRHELVGAVVERVRAEGACLVSIVRKERGGLSMVLIEIADYHNALALVRALGLAADQRALRISLNHQITNLVDALALATLAGLELAAVLALAQLSLKPGWLYGAIFLQFLMVAVPLILWRVLFGARVTVGLDGILKQRWWKDSYVSFDEIARVDASDGGGPRIILTSGETFPLFAPMSPIEAATVGELLHRRIWQGFLSRSEAYARRRLDASMDTVDARRWIRSMREDLRDRADGYRTAARALLSLEDAIVDERQPLQARVGAAIALRAQQPENARQIRIAAHAAARPEIRALFERIADGASDDELASRISRFI